MTENAARSAGVAASRRGRLEEEESATAERGGREKERGGTVDCGSCKLLMSLESVCCEGGSKTGTEECYRSRGWIYRDKGNYQETESDAFAYVEVFVCAGAHRRLGTAGGSTPVSSAGRRGWRTRWRGGCCIGEESERETEREKRRSCGSEEVSG